jgi:hypothetical protein
MLVAATAAACATASPIPNSDATAQKGYVVTIVQANVDRETKDHKPWHEKKPHALRHFLDVLGPLSPILSAAAAVADQADSSGGPVPPSPRVDVRFENGDTIQSFAIPMTLEPKWNWSFAIDTSKHPLESKVNIVIVDDDVSDGGGSTLAQFPITVGGIVHGAVERNSDSVKALQIAVSPDNRTRKQPPLQFSVPANHAEIRNASQSKRTDVWHPIEVLNGDFVRIQATGYVKIVSEWIAGTDELGPGGREPSLGTHLQPLEGCESTRHRGGLVAIISGRCREIGTGSEFRIVGESGPLFLLVNDNDKLGKNSGQFDVMIDVVPPSAQRADEFVEESEK